MSNVPAESIFQIAAITSGLVTPQQLDYCLRLTRHRHQQQGQAADQPVSDELLSEILVEQEILTSYQADQLRAGRTKLNLGPYIITHWIGQGGMGQVFKAEHRLMGRVCAVKVLPRTRATQEARDSFAREIRMQAGLDCPYLVRAYDAGQDGNVHYLVTEYVPGMDLRRLVKRQGPMPVQQAAKIIMQAAFGLEYAHSKGLVHRDVKPGNILVTPSGDAKVSDVGLAGFAKDLLNDPRAGKIIGTADYLSPEQIKTPLEIQAASDIYSLGCTLYYAICGKVPFPGGDTASKMHRHLEETPWHPRRFAPEVTEDFVDIIADMMDKDPSKRIASAAEVAARLEPWSADTLGFDTDTLHRSPWMAPPPPSHAEDSDRHPSSGPNAREGGDRNYEGVAGEDSAVGGRSASSVQSSDIGMPTEADSAEARMFPMIGTSNTGSAATSSSSLTPSPTTSTVPTNTKNPKLSRGMLIALTLAIAVPPALLVGAIIGYLASQ